MALHVTNLTSKLPVNIKTISHEIFTLSSTQNTTRPVHKRPTNTTRRCSNIFTLRVIFLSLFFSSPQNVLEWSSGESQSGKMRHMTQLDSGCGREKGNSFEPFLSHSPWVWVLFAHKASQQIKVNRQPVECSRKNFLLSFAGFWEKTWVSEKWERILVERGKALLIVTWFFRVNLPADRVKDQMVGQQESSINFCKSCFLISRQIIPNFEHHLRYFSWFWLRGARNYIFDVELLYHQVFQLSRPSAIFRSFPSHSIFVRSRVIDVQHLIANLRISNRLQISARIIQYCVS